jgi:UDP-glucose 4-epimerase
MLSCFPYTRALVTGGAGFIGSHIVEELLKLGVKVVSVDNYFAGKRENLAGLEPRELLHEIECDVTDYEALKPCFEGVDIIFHEAASKKTICLNDPRRDLEINAKGTFNVLELARDFGVRKIVHASTGSVYGEALYTPQDEEHPLRPTSYYGVSKLAGEKYVQAFAHLYGMNTTVLRYFHVYGPRQESSDVGGVVPIFIRRLLHGQPPIIFGDGTQQRSFTYVKDVVRANILVAVHPQAQGAAFNCASGVKITIRELADSLIRLCGHEGQLEPLYEDWVPGDIKVFDISNQNLRETGFEFETNWDTGLRETLTWYRHRFEKGLL